MRENRTLVLRRELLADLAPEELRDVAGATRHDSCHVTWYCRTMHYDCPTEPIRECLSLNDPCIQTA